MNIKVCENPWCKGHFEYKGDDAPKVCPKCKSFDTELSDGVIWKNKEYEGNRFDGTPHEININIKKFQR